MNVAEEAVFEECPTFNVNYLLAWESLWQWVVVAFFWWSDIIP